MHFQAVEVALLAGGVATEALALLGRLLFRRRLALLLLLLVRFRARVEAAAADPDVVADRDGQTVHRVLLVLVWLLVDIGQQPEQGLPDGLGDLVQAPVEGALGQHPWDVAVFLEEAAAPLLVAIEQSHGHQ